MELSLLSSEFGARVFWGNSYEQYLQALIIALLLVFGFVIFQKILLARLRELSKGTKTTLDDLAVNIVGSLQSAFYVFLSFYIGLQFLSLNHFLDQLLSFVLVAWSTYELISAGKVVIKFLVDLKIMKEDDSGTRSAVKLLGRLGNIVLWIVGSLFVLSNLGVNVSSLIAGLGIGGIAIALALQNILEDLFSSFSLYFDKPFKPGDFIVVGDQQGTVLQIGIKTTRLLALQGEEIVISNKELTTAKIHNYKKLEERRVVFQFGIVYETKSTYLAKVSAVVKEVIDPIKKTRFEYATLDSFGDSALVFEVAYYVQTKDYIEYKKIHQSVLLALSERLLSDGVEFAYPTQVIHIEK